MPSIGPISPDPSNASGMSRTPPSSAQSGSANSYFEHDAKGTSRVSTSSSRKSSGKPKWLSQVKDWLSTAEPSALAMKEQRRSAYKRHGIDPHDPQAAAKMHFPLGKVPEGATTSTSGPTPEQALKQKAANNRTRESLGGGRGSRSGSSGSSLRPGSKDHRVAPWE